ncbi:carbonic anhydrase [Sodalis sp. dw_96]|uniref:carbonic anhydrase n=1 Tax=Sodalis sp. dw_96 TaxID=2719794 RepID=UPI001BD6064C|nr:carbonic anhydrase [Sodalis sp. dw_96]
MNVIDTLLKRNKTFAATDFNAALNIVPSMKTMIIGCVDSRVDPADILGLQPGEAVVIRNVGGRIEPSTLHIMSILGTVTKASGGVPGTGWNLIVLHHTDCGIKPCLTHAPGLLAKYFDVPPNELDKLAINDPYASVRIDVAALKANPQLPGDFLVTGLVYDVDTGKVQTVVPSAPLRP